MPEQIPDDEDLALLVSNELEHDAFPFIVGLGASAGGLEALTQGS